MNRSVAYLKEILSNYIDRSDTAREIYSVIKKYDFTTEESFVEKLTDQQMEFLNEMLPKEMEHAKETEDEKRLHELNDIYEWLY